MFKPMIIYRYEEEKLLLIKNNEEIIKMNIKIKKDSKVTSENIKSYIIDFLNFDSRFENDKDSIVYDLNFIENYHGIKIDEVEVVDCFAEGFIRITLNYDNGDVNYYEIV